MSIPEKYEKTVVDFDYLYSVNYGLMEAKVPPINELEERQRERSRTLWSKD